MSANRRQQLSQPPRDGASVEHSSKPDIRRRSATPTPILRLRINADTNEVTVDEDSAQRPTDAAAPSSSAGEDQPVLRIPERFRVRAPRSTARVDEHDSHVEVWDSNESGLTWGEKRSRDGTWAEKWMQQQRKVRNDDGTERTVVSGRNNGWNADNGHKWTEKWEKDGLTLKIHKSVQKVDRNGMVIEAWEEEIEETLMSVIAEDGHTTKHIPITQAIRKRGQCELTGRQWQEGTSFEKEKVDSFESDEHGLIETSFQGEFEERQGNLRRGKRTRRDAEGTSFNEVWFREVNGSGNVLDEWTDRWRDNADGTKCGEKKGRNTLGEKWHERWVERDGDREVDKWAETADSRHRWGEKAGTSHDGTQYNEKWERTAEDGREKYFLDKWWSHPDGGSWGEKAVDVHHLDVRGARGAGAATDDHIDSICKVTKSQEYREKWYDNGTEKVIDKWETCTAFDTPDGPPSAIEEDMVYTTTSAAAAHADDSKAVIAALQNGEKRLVIKGTAKEIVKNGEKSGHRYSDSMSWGERWGESFEPKWDDLPTTTTTSSSTETEVLPRPTAWKPDVCLTGRIAKPADSEGEAASASTTDEHREILKLRVRHWDKWWREGSGNSWGDKKFEDVRESRSKEERWYDNGLEKQVDRWETRADGSKEGEKFGSRVDGTQWGERWGAGPAGDGEWVDKHWTVQGDDGKAHSWGETWGNEGGKRWFQKWGRAEGGGEGEEWTEKWDDDGAGNTKTIKEGTAWRAGEFGGREVTNWFADRFGECADQSEKWAFKEGYNAGSGDKWMEKWNEKPGHKMAQKTGQNARGDAWEEQWSEQLTQKGLVKFAEKKGHNAQGDAWLETWLEENENKKRAKKTGRRASGDQWEEEWGEDISLDGAGEKWTSKWASNAQGDRWGNNWGDRWGVGGIGGHRWVEKWHNEDIDKWSGDTAGRPAGC
ncbi:unnamed protein product [Vitrella brassicaformis CCMP3155]|uniref:Uncharacterized protein n=2 Tax=Vitrella brassicaformis TaxID=1169539 RepID=A0A0G4FN54_VITBC|nr:unnamed protein product [Vitrella brassicaformis CCMP3155]|eukprot:CEM15615.1 unnamed protein product [Vitrella brassicaformis CCMP3155]